MARATLVILGLGLLLVIVTVIRLVVGGGVIGWPDGALLDLRVDRLASAAIVGAGLAAGGVMLQSLMRNPLASPDLMGLASGASLAVVASAYAGLASGASSGVAAFLGAIGTLALVYSFSLQRGSIDPATLVLVGVLVSIVAGAATMVIAQLMPDRGLAIARWTIGAIDDEATDFARASVGLATLAGITLGAILGPAMDASALGDDASASVGVPLRTLRVVLFVTAGMLTAGAVMLAGPIGFVGLIAPHAVRRLAGPNNRTLMIGAPLAGAALMVAADAAISGPGLARGRLPIGVVTALIGGPMLILMLRRGRAAGS